MRVDEWVYCPHGRGHQHESDGVSRYRRHFPQNAVGVVRAVTAKTATVWLIGSDQTWDVPSDEIKTVDVQKTGDKFPHKICNVCHCLLPVKQFAKNQTNQHGIIRRPSCVQCRTDIDKRAVKSRQAKIAEKQRPKKGTPFKCPICRRRSIAGITAKIVADHNHHTGDIRDFICDSCNTGLGRFKNGADYLHNAIAYLEERDEIK